MRLIEDETGDDNPRPCIMCGQATNGRGFFIPTPEVQRSLNFTRRFGEMPAGKTRGIMYPICNKCTPKNRWDAEKTSKQVEEMLLGSD